MQTDLRKPFVKGHGPSVGLRLDASLVLGTTACCATFGNTAPLGGFEAFSVKSLEVWGFLSASVS
jgi:hypothetical protein